MDWFVVIGCGGFGVFEGRCDIVGSDFCYKMIIVFFVWFEIGKVDFYCIVMFDGCIVLVIFYWFFLGFVFKYVKVDWNWFVGICCIGCYVSLDNYVVW